MPLFKKIKKKNPLVDKNIFSNQGKKIKGKPLVKKLGPRGIQPCVSRAQVFDHLGFFFKILVFHTDCLFPRDSSFAVPGVELS